MAPSAAVALPHVAWWHIFDALPPASVPGLRLSRALAAHAVTYFAEWRREHAVGPALPPAALPAVAAALHAATWRRLSLRDCWRLDWRAAAALLRGCPALTSLDVTNLQGVAPAALEKSLEALPALRTLVAPHLPGLARLDALPAGLTELDVRQSLCSDAAWEALARVAPRLRRLRVDVSHSRLLAAALREAAGLEELVVAPTDGDWVLGADALAAIGRPPLCDALVRLELCGLGTIEQAAAAAELVGRCGALTRLALLDLSYPAPQAAPLRHTRLRVLDLSFASPSRAARAAASGSRAGGAPGFDAPALTALQLRDAAFPPLPALVARHPRLVHLQLSNRIVNAASVSDADVAEAVRALPHLESLGLSRHKLLTDEGMRAIARLTRLRTLNVGYTGCTPDGLAAVLRGCTRLAALGVSGCPQLSTPATLAALCTLAPRTLHELQARDLGLGQSVPDAPPDDPGAAPLPALPVAVLDISALWLRRRFARPLVSPRLCPALEVLTAQGWDTEALLPVVADAAAACPQLRRVFLGYARVGVAAAEALLRGARRLERLYLVKGEDAAAVDAVRELQEAEFPAVCLDTYPPPVLRDGTDTL